MRLLLGEDARRNPAGRFLNIKGRSKEFQLAPPYNIRGHKVKKLTYRIYDLFNVVHTSKEFF
jgi:hypothetical protein